MRWLLEERFNSNIKPFLGQISEVAIIGGSTRDAEAVILRKLNPMTKFTIFGIENEDSDPNFHFLDLNEKWANKSTYNFDLILCSQVLEHVWHHQNFFENISGISKEKTLLWMGCPASNMVHGSPSYFSAGFTSEYLRLNLTEYNFEYLNGGQIGSRRNYVATHLNREWLSENEHKRPVRDFVWKNGTFLGKINRYRKFIMGRIFLVFQSSNITTELEYATESWVFAIKKS